MQIDKGQRKAIAASVIATLIVLYFINPIFSFLGRSLLSISEFAFRSYLDRLYSEIASGDPNYGFLFLSFFTQFFLLFAYYR